MLSALFHRGNPVWAPQWWFEIATCSLSSFSFSTDSLHCHRTEKLVLSQLCKEAPHLQPWEVTSKCSSLLYLHSQPQINSLLSPWMKLSTDRALTWVLCCSCQLNSSQSQLNWIFPYVPLGMIMLYSFYLFIPGSQKRLWAEISTSKRPWGSVTIPKFSLYFQSPPGMCSPSLCWLLCPKETWRNCSS